MTLTGGDLGIIIVSAKPPATNRVVVGAAGEGSRSRARRCSGGCERAQVELGLRFATGLWRFWCMHSHLGEGRAWAERILALDAAAQLSLRARVLWAAGLLTQYQRDYTRAAPP